MSPGHRPLSRSTRRAGRAPTADRYGAGQVLAVVIVGLIALPLLPLILLIVLWIRLRDRLPARARRPDPEVVPRPRTTPAPVGA
jgi:hypothetical protein